MHMKPFVGAAFGTVVAFFVLCGNAYAGPLDFSYSFAGDQVTGTIDGLSDNSTSAATNFYIDTVASSAGVFSLPLPYDLVPDAGANQFTVTNGQVTGINFNGDLPDGGLFDFYTGYDYFFYISGEGINAQDISYNTGESFTAATGFAVTPLVATPEPTTLALFGAGLLGLGFLYRRRSMKRAT